MNKQIVLIRFSSRNSGNSAKISKFIKDHYRNCNVQEFTVCAENCLPCHTCDYECLRHDQRCPHQDTVPSDVMKSICNSCLVYFIIPNYCGFPCASYFAFNERSVGFFNRNTELLDKYLSVQKRFIAISNSEGEVFREAMAQQVKDEPEILYLKSHKYGKKSIAGDIMDSEAAKAELEAFLSAVSL